MFIFFKKNLNQIKLTLIRSGKQKSFFVLFLLSLFISFLFISFLKEGSFLSDPTHSFLDKAVIDKNNESKTLLIEVDPSQLSKDYNWFEVIKKLNQANAKHILFTFPFPKEVKVSLLEKVTVGLTTEEFFSGDFAYISEVESLWGVADIKHYKRGETGFRAFSEEIYSGADSLEWLLLSKIHSTKRDFSSYSYINVSYNKDKVPSMSLSNLHNVIHVEKIFNEKVVVFSYAESIFSDASGNLNGKSLSRGEYWALTVNSLLNDNLVREASKYLIFFLLLGVLFLSVVFREFSSPRVYLYVNVGLSLFLLTASWVSLESFSVFIPSGYLIIVQWMVFTIYSNYIEQKNDYSLKKLFHEIHSETSVLMASEESSVRKLSSWNGMLESARKSLGAKSVFIFSHQEGREVRLALSSGENLKFKEKVEKNNVNLNIFKEKSEKKVIKLNSSLDEYFSAPVYLYPIFNKENLQGSILIEIDLIENNLSIGRLEAFLDAISHKVRGFLQLEKSDRQFLKSYFSLDSTLSYSKINEMTQTLVSEIYLLVAFKNRIPAPMIVFNEFGVAIFKNKSMNKLLSRLEVNRKRVELVDFVSSVTGLKVDACREVVSNALLDGKEQEFDCVLLLKKDWTNEESKNVNFKLKISQISSGLRASRTIDHNVMEQKSVVVELTENVVPFHKPNTVKVSPHLSQSNEESLQLVKDEESEASSKVVYEKKADPVRLDALLALIFMEKESGLEEKDLSYAFDDSLAVSAILPINTFKELLFESLALLIEDAKIGSEVSVVLEQDGDNIILSLRGEGHGVANLPNDSSQVDPDHDYINLIRAKNNAEANGFEYRVKAASGSGLLVQIRFESRSLVHSAA